MRIRLPTSELWLCDGRGCSPADRIGFKNLPLEATQHLRRLSSDVFSMRILREGCMERGILIALRSNADVIRIASGMLATGQFHFCRWDGGAFGKASPVQAIREAREGTRAARARESQQEQDHETKIRKSWIEIRLVDEKNKPVPGVAYRIQLPDGAIRSGSLDEDGSAYVGGIDPGQCQVTFPELDGRDWKRS